MVTTLEIATPDGVAEAYLARPEQAGDRARATSAPGVLLYMDAIGLRPQIAAMAERIASWGYTVLAPNVFYRWGTAEELAPRDDLRVAAHREAFFASGAMDRVLGLTPDLAGRDAHAYVTALDEVTGAGVLATTGYCMGARLAVRTAGWFPRRVAAVGGFHGGGLVTDEPDSPHRSIAGTVAEYVFGHADHDRTLTPEHAATLGEALQAAGVAYRNEIYPDAPHGYTMADTSSYQEAGAERHYAELEGLLVRTLPA